MSMTSSDELVFADDDDKLTREENATHRENWKVLIVDDEIEIHSVTKLALRHFQFDARGLTFLDAYSGAEAMQLIEEHPDTAIILLDVVMENDSAGLEVAHHIREKLHNKLVRIILRTGQPGAAPEKDVIVNYEINEYKAKAELTSQKLFTTFIATLRNYRDLIALNDNRIGLEKIVEASGSLFEIHSLELFITGVLTQITALLRLEREAVFCQSACFASAEPAGEILVLAGTGTYASCSHQPAQRVLPEHVYQDLQKANEKRTSLYFDNRSVFFFFSKSGKSNMVYFEGVNALKQVDRHLLEVFSTNTAIAIDNIFLTKEIEDTQKEIVFRMGAISESRSKETGNHVKRVAEYSQLLAQLHGLEQREVELVRQASPMHDLGKIGIPDSILNKPGPLDEGERHTMMKHAALGYEILKGSDRPILNAAAIIAHQHHEKWDGTGYPNGLKGKDIHFYGRITALADVYDALASDRPYKKAWPIEEIIDLIRKERGKHFDPELADLLLANVECFVEIGNELKDVEL